MLDTITQRICDKTDAELRQKLADSTEWIWEETGSGAPQPGDEDLLILNETMKEFGVAPREKFPWIGTSRRDFIEICFLYLRDRYRKRAVDDFMEKATAIRDVLGDAV